MDGGQHLHPTSVATVTRQHSRSADGRRHLEKQYSDTPTPPSPPPPSFHHHTSATLMDTQSNHLHIPHALGYKGAFNRLHAGMGVQGLPPLMPPPTKHLFTVSLALPLPNTFLTFHRLSSIQQSAKGSPAPPFLLAARRETHNDLLRTTWDTVTAGVGWGRVGSRG